MLTTSGLPDPAPHGGDTTEKRGRAESRVPSPLSSFAPAAGGGIDWGGPGADAAHTGDPVRARRGS